MLPRSIPGTGGARVRRVLDNPRIYRPETSQGEGFCNIKPIRIVHRIDGRECTQEFDIP